MKFLPFANVVFRTKLSPEEAIGRLKENIEPIKVFRWRGPFGNTDHKPYEGKIEQNTFRIKRIIGYRNSFLPRIKGQIEQDYQGTKISVKMRLHPFVFVFLIAWLSVVGSVFMASLSEVIQGKALGLGFFIPLLMLFVGFFIIPIGFNPEKKKAIKDLAQYFEAEVN